MAGKESVKSTHQNQQNPTTLREILETDNLANMVRYHLGMRTKKTRDEQGRVTNEEQVLSENALLNERGIEAMVGLMRSIVDKNVTMSVYSDKEISSIMVDFHRTVSKDLAYNWVDYEVGSEATFDKVVAIVTNNFYSALKRARNGVTLEKTTDTTQTVTKSEVTESGNDSGGILSL